MDYVESEFGGAEIDLSLSVSLIVWGGFLLAVGGFLLAIGGHIVNDDIVYCIFIPIIFAAAAVVALRSPRAGAQFREGLVFATEFTSLAWFVLLQLDALAGLEDELHMVRDYGEMTTSHGTMPSLLSRANTAISQSSFVSKVTDETSIDIGSRCDFLNMSQNCQDGSLVCAHVLEAEWRLKATTDQLCSWFVVLATGLSSLRTRFVFKAPLLALVSVGLVLGIALMVDGAALNLCLISSYSVLLLAGIYSREKQRRSLYNFQCNQTRELRWKNDKIARKKKQISRVSVVNAKLEQQLFAAQNVIRSSMKKHDRELSRLEISHASLQIEREVGEGSFGIVCKGILRRGTAGEFSVAIKTLRVSAITKNVMERFTRELLIMQPLRHRNIVRLHGGCWNEGADKLCIVLEFCPHGSLITFFKNRLRTAWRGIRHGVALGAAQALNYLHSEFADPIIHRDIKPDNFLMGENDMIKLADFGEARSFDKGLAMEMSSDGNDALTMTAVGTRVYCAPEVLCGERYSKFTCTFFEVERHENLTLKAPNCVAIYSDESADTFSYSLVLLCLVLGDIGYVEREYRRLGANAYPAGLRPHIPIALRNVCPDLVALIEQMWHQNLAARPKFSRTVPEIEAFVSLELPPELPGDENRSEVGSAPLPVESTTDDLDPNCDQCVNNALVTTLIADIAKKDAIISDLKAKLSSVKETLPAVALRDATASPSEWTQPAVRPEE